MVGRSTLTKGHIAAMIIDRDGYVVSSSEVASTISILISYHHLVKASFNLYVLRDSHKFPVRTETTA